MIKLHHLNRSRSHRIIWLLEEIGAEYEIAYYQRDKTTNLAPPELLDIHPLGKSPMIELDGRPEGAVSADGRIAGCYLHGIFAADGYRGQLLSCLRSGRRSEVKFEQGVDEALDALADHLAAHLDLERLLEIARDR